MQERICKPIYIKALFKLKNLLSSPIKYMKNY
jgi:hypothetical protein